jgi:hypothetical protein
MTAVLVKAHMKDRDLGRLSIFRGGTGQTRREDARSARLVDKAIGRLLAHQAGALWFARCGTSIAV